MSFFCEGKLRSKPRGRAILFVGIVRPVGVEAKLAIIPVEDRSVHELAITVRVLPLPVHNHQKSRFTARKIQAYILSFLNFIWEQSDFVFRHLHKAKASSVPSR